MKKFYTLFLLILISLPVKSQEYSFPLFFVDSKGNRDTLVFGFDKSATDSIDENLGEKNILGEPYDSSLFVFFTDAASKNKLRINPSNPINPTFLSKAQYNSNPYMPFEIGIITQNWLISIFWGTEELFNFNIDYFLGLENMFLIMTSWHPTGGWFDARICGDWPEYPYTVLSKKSYIVTNFDNFCHYKIEQASDTISLLYLGFEQITPINNYLNNDFSCTYFPNKQVISISGNHINENFQLRVFDICGIEIYSKSELILNGQSIEIPMTKLSKGLFFVDIFFPGSKSHLTRKIFNP